MAITKLPRSGIADNSINASKIEDGTVAIAEVSGTISNAKLKDGEIANAKLSNSSISFRGSSVSLGGSTTLSPDVNWQSVVVSDGSTVTTMVAGQGYFVNNTSAAGIVKLPTSAAIGDTIAIKDYAGNFGTNNLTIQRNGHKIQGEAIDSELSTDRASVTLVYVDTTRGWLFADEHNVGDLRAPTFTEATGGTITTSGDFKIHTFTGDGCFVVSQIGNSPTAPTGGPSNVDYLVVAGGGGGGYQRGGGGGAGGFRESHSTPVSGCYTASPLATPTGITVSATTYPITVGGGGTGGTYPSTQSTNGSNSVFSTITSAGGGASAEPAIAPERNGQPGGSGGGGVGSGGNPSNVGGTGNTPPVSPPQGNNGGAGSPSAFYGAGGGGGAGTAGTAGSGPTSGPGGNGATTSISGSPTTYGGGGGGSHFTPTGSAGSGGTGGGGGGGTASCDAGTGGTNLGGGGGGGAFTNTTSSNPTDQGAAGGKGIVIIRYKFQ